MSIAWEVRDDIAIIRPGHRFDLHSAHQFGEVLTRFRELAGMRELRIDLAEVSYIDSAGLGMLLAAREAAITANAAVSLANAHGSARRALDTSGLCRLFAVIR